MRKNLNSLASLPRLGLLAALIITLGLPRETLWPVVLIMAAADLGERFLDYVKHRWPIPTKELGELTKDVETLESEVEKIKSHISTISMQQGIRPGPKSPAFR